MVQIIASRYMPSEGNVLYLVHTPDGPEWFSEAALQQYEKGIA